MSKQLEELKRQAVQLALKKKTAKGTKAYLEVESQYRQLAARITELERSEDTSC